MLEDDPVKALEALVIHDPDLERLEVMIAEFNIFEALGAVRQELRHSDFLGFLFDPAASHGLGDRFLKRFLMRALAQCPNSPLSPITIDRITLDRAVVLREWQHIDILIHDAQHRLVVVIENKIDSGEHGNQLPRYLKIARQNFADCTIVPIFLTREGVDPSETAYIPVSYTLIADVLTATLDSYSSLMGPDVATLLRHYVTMLRRHIVSDSDIADLCRQIYQRHQRALDLIFEHRPDLQLDIRNYLVQLIEASGQFNGDRYSKWHLSFCPKVWDALPVLLTAPGWTGSGRMLLFEFYNPGDRLALHLILGPGQPDARAALHALAQQHKGIFKGVREQQSRDRTTIFKAEFLRPHDFEDASFDDLTAEIDRKWNTFLSHDLPAIAQIVNEAHLPDRIS